MTQKENSRLVELSKEVDKMVGFGAQKLGFYLKEEEIKPIVEYCSLRGGNTKYVDKMIRGRGRPFSLGDPTFTERCLICRALRNYCCC